MLHVSSFILEAYTYRTLGPPAADLGLLKIISIGKCTMWGVYWDLVVFLYPSVNYHSNGKSQHVPYFSWGTMGFHSFFLRFKARLLVLSGATQMGPRSVRKYFRLERDLHRATTYADYRKAEEAQEMEPSERRSCLCLFVVVRDPKIYL